MVGLFAVLLVLGAFSTTFAAADSLDYDPERFEKEILVHAAADPMQIEVLPDGRVLFIELEGTIKLYRPPGEVVVVGKLPIVRFGEVGLMGLALDTKFAENGWVYLFWSPQEKHGTIRLSRFTIREDRLDLASEKLMFDYPVTTETAAHMGGGMFMTPEGMLFIGTGDNCHPIPELPVDQRPGREGFDAFRSSANSQDLRGKVLRIRPNPDSSYTIPEGNLFADPEEGRPEIYCMGTRNAFRLSVDPRNGYIYWGDVGPNILDRLGLGPNGYDEMNQARQAGNFGWPLFVGPNEAYRNFDFATRTAGEMFDVENPVNNSRNNTGIRNLPRPQPAFIWYPTTESKDFPSFGSGARVAMVGPVYYYDEALKSDVKLPKAFDHTLIIYEWARNWIKMVHLDDDDRIERIEPFLDNMTFRKPMDMKLARDGSLYLVEQGDRWSGNLDSKIVRIVYRHGNRPPVPIATADVTEGRHPLSVQFDGSASFEKDEGDAIRYRWDFGVEGAASVATLKAAFTYEQPGTYAATLTTTDPHGASAQQQLTIRVGNARPVVRILEPGQGGVFDWEEPIAFRVEVTDEEDGSTVDGTIPAGRVVVRSQYRQKRRMVGSDALGRATTDEDTLLEPGLALMRKTTCFACHTTDAVSAGPPYAAVARRYHDQPKEHARLAEKIITGGAGVWGSKPMPPHPQHTVEQTRQMVGWIMSLAQQEERAPIAATEGAVRAVKFPGRRVVGGVMEITATYTDNGAEGAAPLTATATRVLHARRRRAAHFDRKQGARVVDEYEGESTLTVRFGAGDWIALDELDLTGIASVGWRAGSIGGRSGRLELRLDDPAGPLLGSATIKPGQPYRDVNFAIEPVEGSHEVFVVAVSGNATDGKVEANQANSPVELIGVTWVQFLDSPEAAVARKARIEIAATILKKQEELAAQRAASVVVRNWTFKELAADMHQAERGRSFERGKQLFASASCKSCHAMAGEGGTLAPDLTKLHERMAKRPNAREAILLEMIEPSAFLEDKYATYVLLLTNGRVVSGLVVKHTNKIIELITDPLQPKKVTRFGLGNIEMLKPTGVSAMPAGLLSTLTKDEIWDLLAYLESGGNAEYAAYKKN